MRVAIAARDGDVVANGLQRGDGPAVGLDRRVALTLFRQQPPGLPRPAVERIGRLRLLRGKDRAPGQRQRLGGAFFKLVERALVAERKGQRAPVARFFRVFSAS